MEARLREVIGLGQEVPAVGRGAEWRVLAPEQSLVEPVTSDIEVRVCGYRINDEDTPFKQIELYCVTLYF